MSGRRLGLLNVLMLCVALLFFAPQLAAQTAQGQINGTVTDPSGKVVPGAQVVLRNMNTGTERKTVTSAAGVYFLSSIPPGHYTISISAKGFQSYIVPELTLTVREARTVNAQLVLGSVTQRVEVKVAPVALKTTKATIGTVIQHRDIVQIPLNGRNFTQLIALTPGVAPVQTGQQNAFIITGGISPAVNGMRPQMNNFTLDGVDNNQRFSNSYAEAPPPDAIAEFKVASHETGAEVSLAAGANVNIVTRSGTNELHGSAWDFLRNNALDARNYFDNFYGSPILPFRQNQFGYFVGGPVYIPHLIDGRKTHTYFATYYQGLRYSRSVTTEATVPTPAERNGNFSDLLGSVIGTDCLGRPILQNEIYDPTSTVPNASCPGGYVRNPFPGNTIPSINPVAAAYLKYYYPSPNRSGIPNLVLAQDSTQTANQWGIRIDQSISDRQEIFTRISHYNWVNSSPGALPGNTLEQQNHGTNVAGIHYTYTLSPTLVMDFLAGYNRSGIPLYNPGLGGAEGAAFDQAVGPTFYNKFTVGGNVPLSQSLGGSRFSSANFISYELANPDYTYQYDVDFTKATGKHMMSFGVNFMRFRHIASDQGAGGMGYAPQTTGLPGVSGTGESLASFMLGYPTSSREGILPYFDDWGNIYNAYFGDTWKLTPKFTVDLGLQYVYASPPLVKQGGTKNAISLFDYTRALTQPNATDFTYAYIWCSVNPITGAQPNSSHCPTIMRPDKKDWAPRIGLAYAPFKNTVIRTGFGMFYDFNSNIEQNSIRVSQGGYPYSTSVAFSGQNLDTLGPLNPPLSLSNPFPVAPASAPIPEQGINPTNKTPYALEWNFGVEHLLPGAMKLSVNYVASEGVHLINSYQQNEAVLGPGSISSRRPLHNAGVFPNRYTDGTSSYDSLQIKLERKFTSGLTFLNSFTWAKAIDESSDANGFLGPPSYTYNRNLSRARADFNIPVTNSTSFVYFLPFGRGQRFGSGIGSVPNQFIGGWQASGIVTIRDGLGYSIINGQDIANIGGIAGLQTGLEVGNPLPSGFTPSRAAWFDPTAFVFPAVGTLGNTTRNSFNGPAYADVDFALMKNFPLWERVHLQFRSEFFNLFNHTNFGNPDNNLSSPLLGQILSAYPSREIQFALKVLW